MKYRCNLCSMAFEKDDELILNRMERHEKWHKNAQIEKRNTTYGIVKWDIE